MLVFEKLSNNRVYKFVNRETTLWLGLCFIGILGFATVYASTPLGLGVREDSYSYITAAESLANGTGLGRWTDGGEFRPLTHFPPLLPIFLSSLSKAGIEFLEASRLINASAFALTLLFSGYLIYRVLASKFMAMAGASYILCSPILIEAHAWSQSEPLFLSLCIIGLTLLANYLNKSLKVSLLIISASFYSLGFLTRYAGISFIVAGTVGIVLASSIRRFTRLKLSLGFLGISILPTFIFALGNQISYGNSVDRPLLSWHPPPTSIWESGARTILNWFVDTQTTSELSSSVVFFYVTAIILIFIFITWNFGKRRPKKPEAEFRINIERLLVYSAPAYLILVLVTLFWFDRLTPLDERILSPLYLFCILILISSIGIIWENSLSFKFFIIVGLITAIVLFQAYRGLQEVKKLRITGLGLTTWSWHASPAMQFIQQLPDDVRIYTNDIPAIYFLAGRDSSFIPTRNNPALDEKRFDYTKRLREMRWDIDNEGAILSILGPGASSKLNSGYMDELTERLCLYEEFQDGIFFRTCADP